MAQYSSTSSIAVSSGDALALVGRICIAALFLPSGIGKFQAPEGVIDAIAAAGLLMPTGIYLGTLAIEVGGSIALAVGFMSRLTAAILALFSVGAALLFHADWAVQDQFIHFLKNMAVAGGLLQIVAFGGGRRSFDDRLGLS